ncbi:MAG: hypothetical protein HQL69_15820 [Magnetococcales bacterium]|nr:hypothetical protein [Magnetococcales bacterium]
MYKNRKTPGVYVTELDAFPPSVVSVETAVPAFIGYTEKAVIDGKPVFMKPVKLTSMVDFDAIFGGGYTPNYNIVTTGEEEQAANDAAKEEAEQNIEEGSAEDYDFIAHDENGKKLYCQLEKVGSTTFNLYNSMKLFYANGGGKCYVVSVGDYEKGQTINKNHLKKGLRAIGDEVGPTILVVPDAVLIEANDPKVPYKSSGYAEVAKTMLKQCHDLQDRVAILDVYGSGYAKKTNLDDVATQFRTDVGSNYLSYGMGYFPFLTTSIVSLDDVSFQNITTEHLLPLLNAEVDMLYPVTPGNPDAAEEKDKADKPHPKNAPLKAEIAKIAEAKTAEEVTKLDQNLVAAIPLLKDIEKIIVTKNQTLPPSGAMAGVFSATDSPS